MVLDEIIGWASWKPEKGFFDTIREGWENLKDFLSEKFSAIRDTLSNLNILKKDVADGSHNATSGTVCESVESNPQNLNAKLKQICVRSRKYGDVNKNDEWYVSFWKLQFHWETAKKILRNIKASDASRFNSIMTDPLFRDTDVACTSVWNDTHVTQFKELMNGSKAQYEMDKVVDETIDGYINRIKWRWVTDPKATLAFWRICNYWPAFAEKIKNIMVSSWKNINDYEQVIDCYESNTSWHVRTKFQKPDPALWNKNIRQFIWEYTA